MSMSMSKWKNIETGKSHLFNGYIRVNCGKFVKQMSEWINSIGSEKVPQNT